MADSFRKLRPFELARWQLERDHDRMRRTPVLLARKQQRMSASPFAFLRGTAPLFYRVLSNAPRLARGPDEDGMLCGDLHLENFGVYRPDNPSRVGDRVVFDLNDVDETFIGPFHLDLLRVLTSTLLAARSWGCNAATAIELAGAFVDGYCRARGGGRIPSVPPPVTALLARVVARKRRELLEKHTVVVGHRRKFRIGDNLLWLPRSTRKACAQAFRRFAAGESKRAGHPLARFSVLDVAFRVAGTGSLGTFRVAVLVEGHGPRDGAWMFDMKAMGESAGSRFSTGPVEVGPDRVATALRTLLRSPPVMLGTVRALGHGLLVRRLTPQEDRLDWPSLPHPQRAPTLAYLGGLTAAAHRRGAGKNSIPQLADADGRRVLRNAVELAGLHESVALAYAAELGRG